MGHSESSVDHFEVIQKSDIKTAVQISGCPLQNNGTVRLVLTNGKCSKALNLSFLSS